MTSGAEADAIETHDLVKSFRRRTVVAGISIAVRRGEVIGLLGKNGAGKTTTFYMVVGLLRPDRGRVTLGGREVSRLPMYARARLGIGYLPQEPSVFRRLTVYENLRLVYEMQNARTRRALGGTARLEQLLADFNLQELRNQRGAVLSGGERRRVEIARSLIANPGFILLDEPFTGIDPLEVGAIQQMVRNLKDRGIGILITDHNVRDTLAITDRSYIVKEGSVIASGTSAEIAANPDARKWYLGDDFQL